MDNDYIVEGTLSDDDLDIVSGGFKFTQRKRVNEQIKPAVAATPQPKNPSPVPAVSNNQA